MKGRKPDVTLVWKWSEKATLVKSRRRSSVILKEVFQDRSDGNLMHSSQLAVRVQKR